MSEVRFESLTPVVFVEEIEPQLPFWRDRLGFAIVVDVKEGDKLGFVILARDAATVMLQSRASLRKDVPALGDMPFRSSTSLYVRLKGLDAIQPRLAGLEVVIPRRMTFYGATEIGVRAPSGDLVCLSEHAE